VGRNAGSYMDHNPAALERVLGGPQNGAGDREQWERHETNAAYQACMSLGAGPTH
jgi:hypothetical protein